MLRCSNITVQYANRLVLNNVSITVEPGKMTALIGPSGAGKSTVLRILSFLESPSCGIIEIDGTEYSYPSTDAVTPQPWPKVTAVFQQLFLWPHMTLRKNISLPLRLRMFPDASARVDALIARFDMADFIDRYPNEVSGGQRQRAAIARALALKPSYLLLDEITSALDIEQAAAIISHLDDLKREGIGILLVTHYLGFLQRSADQIVFMEDAEVSESGGPAILSSPRSTGMQRFITAFDKIENRISNQRVLIVPGYAVESLRLFGENQAHSSHKSIFAKQLYEDLAQHTCASDGSISCVLLDEQINLLADASFSRLKSATRDLPNEQDACMLNRIPIVDRLRLLTLDMDVDWVTAGITNERPELSGLLLSLLQRFDTRPDIHAYLLNLWETAGAELRGQLIWRILDKPGLQLEIKEKLLAYVLDDWIVFNNIAKRFLAQDSGVLEQVQQRMNDPRFPTEKTWVYLCRVVEPEPDKAAVKIFLDKYARGTDQFTTSVAETLLRRHFNT